MKKKEMPSRTDKTREPKGAFEKCEQKDIKNRKTNSDVVLSQKCVPFPGPTQCGASGRANPYPLRTRSSSPAECDSEESWLPDEQARETCPGNLSAKKRRELYLVGRIRGGPRHGNAAGKTYIAENKLAGDAM